jgi:hypothetical protein
MNRTQMRQKQRELHRALTKEQTDENRRSLQVMGGLVLNRATRRGLAYTAFGGQR